MARPQLDSPYLRELEKRVLIYDGAMGTSIQRFNLTPEDFGGKSLEGCNDNLVLTRPDVIQAIHESFLAVGVDVVEPIGRQRHVSPVVAGCDRSGQASEIG